MEYLITVDIGTTSTKTLAFDKKGKILLKKSVGYPIINPDPDISEQDPWVILKAVKDTVAAIATEMPEGLIGVSFSAAMHSVIVMSKENMPLTNCIIWADNRSKEEANEIKNSAGGAEIYHRTGTPIHPMSPLCKIAWLKKHNKDVFYNASKFISIKEFVFYNLFGKMVNIDYKFLYSIAT